MARWGKCDFRELEQLNKRLEQLSSVDFDAFCRKMSNEIAARLLAKVKKRTPVGVVPGYGQDMRAAPFGTLGQSFLLKNRVINTL